MQVNRPRVNWPRMTLNANVTEGKLVEDDATKTYKLTDGILLKGGTTCNRG